MYFKILALLQEVHYFNLKVNRKKVTKANKNFRSWNKFILISTVFLYQPRPAV